MGNFSFFSGTSGFVFFSIMGMIAGYMLTQLFFMYVVARKVRYPGSHTTVQWIMSLPVMVFCAAMAVISRSGQSQVIFEVLLFGGMFTTMALFMRGYCGLQQITFPRYLWHYGAFATFGYCILLLRANEFWLRFICLSAMQASIFITFLFLTVSVLFKSSQRHVSHGLWVLCATAMAIAATARLLIALGQGTEFTAVFGLKYNETLRLYILTFAGIIVAGIAMVLGALERALDVTRHAETHDEMTGLANRRAIMAQGRREVELALRSGLGLVVALVDVDFFKRINDTYGHDTGDQVLIEVAKELRAERRQADLVGRYGGEEFLVIFPGEDRPELLGQRLVEHVRTHEFGALPQATISVGLASLPAGATEGSWQVLLHRADEALYAAKRSGRNRAVVYEAPPEAPAAGLNALAV